VNSDNVSTRPPCPWWRFWQRWKDFHKLTAYATLFLALGTAALAIFSLVTLLVTHADTRRLIKEARIASKQQHTDTLTALGKTDATIAAMKSQAEIMQGQLDEMRTDRRAWVGPLIGKLTDALKFNQEAQMVISLQNTGREPATDVAYYFEATTPTTEDDRTGAMQRDIETFVNKCFVTPTDRGAKVLYPTMPFSAADELRIKFPNSYLDWDVIYGQKILLLKHCITYETGQSVHHSSFCYYYWNGVSPDNQLFACGKGGARAN
jgi:hypothetical protein